MLRKSQPTILLRVRPHALEQECERERVAGVWCLGTNDPVENRQKQGLSMLPVSNLVQQWRLPIALRLEHARSGFCHCCDVCFNEGWCCLAHKVSEWCCSTLIIDWPAGFVHQDRCVIQRCSSICLQVLCIEMVSDHPLPTHPHLSSHHTNNTFVRAPAVGYQAVDPPTPL